MLLSLLLCAASVIGDTLTIDRAYLDSPYAMEQPYVTDSLNMTQKAYDPLESLSKNLNLATRSHLRPAATQIVKRGEALTALPFAESTLRCLHFNVQTPHYIKGNFVVKGTKNHRLFINGTECPDKQVNLSPGRTEVSLLILTQKADKDSFNVMLTGPDLKGVTVNAEGKRPFTMTDMLQGDHYAQVQLSPTGKYLITTAYNITPEGKAIYTTDVSETATGRKVWERGEYLRVGWLENDNDVMYFTRTRDAGRELVFVNMANGSEQVIADNLPDGNLTLSPKADYLIISQTEEGTASANGLKRLREPDDRMPDWRKRSSLWRYNLRSRVLHRLTYGSTGMYLCDISADAKSLLLQYSRFDASRSPFDRTTLVRMDAYTGKTDTLLADTAFIASAKFSPKADKLIIMASPAAFNGIGSEVNAGQTPNAFDYRLYTYDIAARKVTPLLRHFGPAVEQYEWASGDGNIYFLATDRTTRALFKLDPQTGKTLRYDLPVSMIQGYSISARQHAPQAVVYGNSAERAREMFIFRLNKQRPEARLIGPIRFDKIYNDIAIGTMHDWRFKATRGDSIDGFYVLPPDFNASRKYPLIVYYYGGCTPTLKSLEYQYPLQIMAGQGYVVYVPNPSGAIGYGQAFAARHVNTWGKESADDIIEGTQRFCEAHTFVDKSRIGCIGASYGGFMTQYLQTRTDLFAAAVSHAGISNITSYWGGGYWGYSYGECAQYGSYPWNNPKLYVEQSPLFNADKIHTPLLLMHGTDDTNVPTNESQQLFTALKILGREVCYVQVEGQNHVITDYKKRLAWQDAIFAWFAKYLKNDATWWNSLNL